MSKNNWTPSGYALRISLWVIKYLKETRSGILAGYGPQKYTPVTVRAEDANAKLGHEWIPNDPHSILIMENNFPHISLSWHLLVSFFKVL